MQTKAEHDVDVAMLLLNAEISLAWLRATMPSCIRTAPVDASSPR
jgi:hypothetical protein